VKERGRRGLRITMLCIADAGVFCFSGGAAKALDDEPCLLNMERGGSALADATPSKICLWLPLPTPLPLMFMSTFSASCSLGIGLLGALLGEGSLTLKRGEPSTASPTGRRCEGRADADPAMDDAPASLGARICCPISNDE